MRVRQEETVVNVPLRRPADSKPSWEWVRAQKIPDACSIGIEVEVIFGAEVLARHRARKGRK